MSESNHSPRPQNPTTFTWVTKKRAERENRPAQKSRIDSKISSRAWLFLSLSETSSRVMSGGIGTRLRAARRAEGIGSCVAAVTAGEAFGGRETSEAVGVEATPGGGDTSACGNGRGTSSEAVAIDLGSRFSLHSSRERGSNPAEATSAGGTATLGYSSVTASAVRDSGRPSRPSSSDGSPGAAESDVRVPGESEDSRKRSRAE